MSIFKTIQKLQSKGQQDQKAMKLKYYQNQSTVRHEIESGRKELNIKRQNFFESYSNFFSSQNK